MTGKEFYYEIYFVYAKMPFGCIDIFSVGNSVCFCHDSECSAKNSGKDRMVLGRLFTGNIGVLWY